MSEMITLIDTCKILLPKNIDTFVAEFKDNDTSTVKKVLEVEADITHGGYVNKNFYYYKPSSMAESVNSLLKPYLKPILIHHNSLSTPVGRTIAAAFIPLALPDTVTDDDLDIPKCKIRAKGLIVDSSAIECILDKRYLTVSVGSSPLKPPICSICKAEIRPGPLGAISGCEHERGKTYDGKLCYWIIGPLEYKEWSFINSPADSGDDHVASVTSFRWVDLPLDGSLPTTDNIALMTAILGSNGEVSEKYKKYIFIDSTNTKDIEEKKQKDSNEKEGVMNYIDEITISALEVLDECEECGDEEDIEEFWTEKDSKEVEDLDKEFEKALEMILDAKIPKAGSKERESMKKSVFCGPNRTFPVPDCKHAAVAMAMLNWPSVKKKYSASVRAKIAACVRRKAKAMNCPMAKKSKKDEYEEPINWTDEELKELQEFDKDFVSTFEIILDKKVPPAGSKEREKMDKRIFCGPNRTFPVPDCKHAAIALAMLNWPQIKKKYSEATRKKIEACVRRKAKAMNCAMSKKDSDNETKNNDFEKEIEEYKNKLEHLEKDHKDSKVKVQELEAELQKANDQVSKLNEENRKLLAEKLIDLSILVKRNSIKDILVATTDEEREEKYKEHVDEELKRSTESLKDAINDLRKDINFNVLFDEKVEEFGLKDQTTKKQNSEKKNSIAEKIFGKK
ncbi:MAG: hypothetical protein ACTSVB_07835 [Candidatus Heimdallarchaeaceae archaeon]